MMPRKEPANKRTVLVGVKVKQSTKDKIKYIAEGESTTISTYILNLIIQNIERYERATKINWDKELNK